MFLSEWREFLSAPCLPEKKDLMTARVSMLMKSRPPLTCFRPCFLPGQAKDLSASQYKKKVNFMGSHLHSLIVFTIIISKTFFPKVDNFRIYNY